MDFHLLDLIIFILLVFVIWYKIFPNNFTEELGALIGIFIMFVFTIIYIILFGFYPNWNWYDIFKSFGESIENINIKL